MGDGVMDLSQIKAGDLTLAGGKAVALAELSRIDGVRVPPGFVVTTGAGAVAAHDLAEALAALGDGPYAVRSSATTEDGLSASAAGQHESYLGVAGPDEVARRVADCRDSLFSDRAVTYRARTGDDGDRPAMAVVVQRMVDARAAGVLFTADPVSGDRRVTRIDAGRGLGDAIVSGQVTPDVYSVRGDDVVDRRVAEPDPVLSDAEILALTELGRRIEAHFGSPQDIEWCLDADGVAVVQSRPITTLFPIPAQSDDGNHVYVSVGHQQMMTDAFKPLGLSFWQMTTPRPMAEAGSRLFVDVTRAQAERIAMLRASDPLTGDALQTVLERGELPRRSGEEAAPPRLVPDGSAAALAADPEIVARLIARNRESVAALQREIDAVSGPALIEFIREDLDELRRLLFDPESQRVIFAGMGASAWLNERIAEWLGETNVADQLSQAAPYNVTAEMGLALLDVADVIRACPAVLAFLGDTDDERFLDALPALAGGAAARDAIMAFLHSYGMRGVGEIDITRPRFAEAPLALVPLILSNVANFAPGAAERRREQGLATARQTERDLLVRLEALPDGAAKAREAKSRIDQIRAFAGYREYPKYGMVSRYAIYKRALLREARRLTAAGGLRRPDDIFFLRFDELAEVVRRGQADGELIRRRRAQFRRDRSLVTPRVLTSHGEMINGRYRRDDVPAGALAGLAVSAGSAEGRARVVSDLATADLQPGDILVTRFTDPSWTPAFVAIAGLVTEVGGLMTHGAVIAREYGLPAVVAVPDATDQIADGQRIRVDGTAGYVELLG